MRVLTKDKFAAPYLRCLFYAVTGNGKTRLVYGATAVPQMCPVLAINVGGNPMSIRDYDHENLTIVEPETLADIDRILNWLDQGQSGQVGWAPLAPYRTIIIDGISDVQAMLSDHLTGGRGSVAEPVTLEGYKQWGAMLQATVTLVRGVYELPMHALVTCLETASEKTGQIVPALSGQTAQRIVHIPAVVGRLTNIDRAPKAVKGKASNDTTIERVLQIGASDQVPYAKWQYGKAAPFMANPSMNKIWGLVASE